MSHAPIHMLAFGYPGPWELAIIFMLLLIIFGPKKLPELARAIGSSVNEFREGLTARPKTPEAPPPSASPSSSSAAEPPAAEVRPSQTTDRT